MLWQSGFPWLNFQEKFSRFCLIIWQISFGFFYCVRMGGWRLEIRFQSHPEKKYCGSSWPALVLVSCILPYSLWKPQTDVHQSEIQKKPEQQIHILKTDVTYKGRHKLQSKSQTLASLARRDHGFADQTAILLFYSKH